MQRLIVSLAASACLAALLGAAAPAYAADNIFVSGSGNDASPCTTVAAPCREIAGATGALAKTTAGGVIHVLPGNYTGFVIDKAIEIIAESGQATSTSTAIGLPGDESAQIVVNAGPDDEVRIRGFLIDGGPVGAIINTHGVVFLAGASLHLEDCTLVGAKNTFGVAFRPSGASELYVSNCAISGNGDGPGGGIQIRPTGSGSANVALDHVDIEDNKVGILVDGGATSGAITMNIRDSEISGSTAQGLGVFEAVSGGASAVVLERTTISSNGAQGIIASRALASVRVRQSVISGNTVGVATANGGQIVSHGDNVLAGNTTNGAFTATVAPQ